MCAECGESYSRGNVSPMVALFYSNAERLTRQLQ